MTAQIFKKNITINKIKKKGFAIFFNNDESWEYRDKKGLVHRVKDGKEVASGENVYRSVGEPNKLGREPIFINCKSCGETTTSKDHIICDVCQGEF